MRLRPVHALLLLPAATGLGLHAPGLRYALLGFDAYPLIIASRVQSWADFKGTFTEIMMDHRFPAGDFYRPSQNAVIAIEYAFWGANPVGYQLTTLLLFTACIATLAFLIRRLLNTDAIAAPLVAGFFFALHQSHLMVLPVVARRVEVLVLLAWLLALLILPVRDQRGLVWRSILAALLILFASGAKENGVLGVGLIALHQLFFSTDSIRTRGRHAVIASGFATCGVVVYVLARLAVVGGAGGYREVGLSFSGWWNNVSANCMAFVEAILCPWNFLPIGNPTTIALVSLLGLTVLSVLAVAIPLVRRAKPLPPYVGLLALGWAWAVANILFNGFAGPFRDRYAMLPSSGTAIVLAAVAQWAISSLSLPAVKTEEQPPESKYATRFVAIVSQSVLIGIVAISLQSSPLFVHYWEWQEATRRENEFLAALDQVLRNARLGTRIEAPLLPYMPESLEKSRPSIGVAMVAGFSIQAWADINYPARKIRVVRADTPDIPPPGPDEILLINQPLGTFPTQIGPD